MISQSSGSTAKWIERLAFENENSSCLMAGLHLFSNFALLTLVSGVALGVFDYLANLMQRRDDSSSRAQTAIVTFILPVIIAIAYPDGFVAALGFAAIALLILAIILPVLIVLRLRKNRKFKCISSVL